MSQTVNERYPDVMTLSHRLATPHDVPALTALMTAAIGELQRGFLTEEEIAASRKLMGLDSQLIADRTYFVIEEDGEDSLLGGRPDAKPASTFAGRPLIAGCGGWSRRATLYGGDHSPGRDAAVLDPAVDAARVRAMYTSPAFARRGVGRLILSLCEAAAKAEGFSRIELAGTLAGEPLYRACGYAVIERLTDDRGGVPVPLARMGKAI